MTDMQTALKKARDALELVCWGTGAAPAYHEALKSVREALGESTTDNLQKFIQKHSPRDGEFEADLIRAIHDLDARALAFAALPKTPRPPVDTVAKVLWEKMMPGATPWEQAIGVYTFRVQDYREAARAVLELFP
jgi:hypothetical protein